MVKPYLIKQQLSPEQNKVLDEVLFQRADTVIAYKILSRQYSETKRKIKAIEKKLIVMMQELGEKDFTPRRIEGEIAAIENKYPVIDKAIKNYKEDMRNFDHLIGMPNFRIFNPERPDDWHIRGMRSHLRSAEMYIDRGLDALRITKRYFKNITEAFQWHNEMQKLRKYRQLTKPVTEPITN